MISKTICVLGGSGFVGHYLVSRLTQAGFTVRVPTRNRERHRSLLVLPKVEVIEADIHNEAELAKIFQGCGAVINLAAILNERGHDTFRKVHVELAGKVVNACKTAGVSRLLHMSALNADAKKGPSGYLRSKGEAEDIVHASGLDTTSFRPAVIFGPDDHFFNRLALMMRYLPLMPVFCPGARLAPIYVGDVVEAIVKCVSDKETYGARYELCGPEAMTLLELTKYTARLTKTKCKLIPLGDGLSALHGRILGLLPVKLFTYDNYLSLQAPAVCNEPFPARFGIQATTLDSVVPKYVGQADIRGRYDTMRRHAARDPE